MKFIKLLINIILLISVVVVNSQTLISEQDTAIRNILIEVFGNDYVNTIDNVCLFESFKCLPINDGTSTSTDYTLTEIIFPSITNATIINNSFQSFKNLTTLSLNNGLSSTKLFNEISSLNYLKKLTISKQLTAIPDNIELPVSLEIVSIDYINVMIGSGFFSSGRISKLTIMSTDSGFSLPSSFPLNNYLTSLSIPISYLYSKLPSNSDNLKALTSLSLSIYNERIDGYTDFELPTLSTSFQQLSTIDITFYNSIDSSYQSWNIPNYLTDMNSLSKLYISGNGFTVDSTIGITDFSNKNSPINIYAQNGCDFIEKCKLPCIKVPVGSGLSISDCNVDLSKIDFTNFVDFSMENNQLSQTLPSTGIEYNKMNSFYIDNKNEMTGNLPESYCQFKDDVLSIGNNLLDGEVPTCFSCSGYNQAGTKYLLPNNFINFNSSSLPSKCSTFSFDTSNYNKIVNTDGSSIITINGKDFGWYYSVDDTTYHHGESIEIITPNSLIEISIPKGEGANKSFKASFGTNYLLEQEFQYSYQVPVINGYSITNNGNSLRLQGTGFSFINTNNVTINNKLYSASISDSSNSISFDASSENPIDSLNNGNKMEISINVGGQISNTVTFYLFKSINFDTLNNNLALNGGDVTFNLDLGIGSDTSQFDISLIKISINNIDCTIKSFQSNKITITYPSVSASGTYPLSLNISGFQFNTTVNYVNMPSSSTTSSSTSSSDDDKPSSSSVLSISLNLFIFLSSLLLL